MKVKPQEPKNAPGPEMRRVKETHQKYDDNGRELMDPVPISPPIGYKKAPSIAENIRNMIRSERLRQEAEEAGYESFEEADDFEVEDYDPRSPYEEQFEPVPVPDDDATMKKFAGFFGDAMMERLGGGTPPEAAPSTPPAPGPTPEAAGGSPPQSSPSPSLDFTSRKPKT